MDDRTNSVRMEIRDLKDRIRAGQLALLWLILLMIAPIVLFLFYILYLIAEPPQQFPTRLNPELILVVSTLWMLPFLYFVSLRQEQLITDRLDLEWQEQRLAMEAIHSLQMREQQSDQERWRQIVSRG